MGQSAATRWGTLAACVVLSGSLIGSTSAGSFAAEQGGCVTRAEFKIVKVGMRMSRVHEIFGTKGADTGLGDPNMMRYYQVCRPPGMVQVTYSPRGRVISKSGNFFS